jgi:hypothetical protein
MNELLSHYSDQELAVINNFVFQCITALQEETAKLQVEATSSSETLKQAPEGTTDPGLMQKVLFNNY